VKRICLIVLFLSLLLTTCISALSESAEDPVVVRVGDITFTQSEVQFGYVSSLDVLKAFNGEVTDEDRQVLLDGTIQRAVDIGVAECKLKQLGKYDFTEEELSTLQYSAQQAFDQTWQELYKRAQEEDVETTEAEITHWLEESGYTVDAYFREAQITERQYRLVEMYCSDIVLKQSDVDDFYMENYVEPDREKYENDIDLYDSEIALTNSEAFFVPEGFRYIKQIVLPLPDGFEDQLKPYERRVKSRLQDAQTVYLELADAAAEAETMEDFAEQKAAYKAAREKMEEARQAYLAKLKEAVPQVQDTVDTIRQATEAGIRFEDSIKKYSIDQQYVEGNGFQFHPNSKRWPEPFGEAIAAMEKPGDLSEPVASDDGVHIFCYMGDVPAGVHTLTDEERAALEQSALRAAQKKKLDELVQEWKADYEIETHPELIDVE
jgi:hypothetical protein